MRTALRSAAIIDAWFDTLTADQRDTAAQLRMAVLKAEPSLAMSIKWGNLVFTYEGVHALAITLHKSHANLQVFNGARLDAEFPRLEGTSRGMRHLKFGYRQALDVELVQDVAFACVRELEAAAAGFSRPGL